MIKLIISLLALLVMNTLIASSFALTNYCEESSMHNLQVRWENIAGKKPFWISGPNNILKQRDKIILKLDNNSLLRIHSKNSSITPDMFDVKISNGSGAYTKAQLKNTNLNNDLILDIGDDNSIVTLESINSAPLSLEFFRSRYEKPAKCQFYQDKIDPIKSNKVRLLEYNKYLPKKIEFEEYSTLNPENSLEYTITGPVAVEITSKQKSFNKCNNSKKYYVSIPEGKHNLFLSSNNNLLVKLYSDPNFAIKPPLLNSLSKPYKNLLPNNIFYKKLYVNYAENFKLSASNEFVSSSLKQNILGYFIKLNSGQKLDFTLPYFETDSGLRILVLNENLKNPIKLYVSYDSNAPKIINIYPCTFKSRQYQEVNCSSPSNKLPDNNVNVKSAAIVKLPLPHNTKIISISCEGSDQTIFIATQYQDLKNTTDDNGDKIQRFFEGLDDVDSSFISPIADKSNIHQKEINYALKMLNEKKWNIAINAFSKIIFTGNLAQWRDAHIHRAYAMKMNGESCLAERSLKALIFKAQDEDTKTAAAKMLINFYNERGHDYGIEIISNLIPSLQEKMNDNANQKESYALANQVIHSFYESKLLYLPEQNIYQNAFIAGPNSPISMQIQGPVKIRIGLRPLDDSKNKNFIKDDFIPVNINDKSYKIKISNKSNISSLVVFNEPSLRIGLEKYFETTLGFGKYNLEIKPRFSKVIVKPMIDCSGNLLLDETIDRPIDFYNIASNNYLNISNILYSYTNNPSKELLVKGLKLCHDSKGQYEVDSLCNGFKSLSRFKPITTLDINTNFLVREHVNKWAPQNIDLGIRGDLISNKDDTYVINGNTTSVIDFTNKNPITITLKASMLKLITANRYDAILGYQIDNGKVNQFPLKNSGDSFQQKLRIDQGNHSLRVFLIDPAPNSFVKFILLDDSLKNILINRKSKYFAIEQNTPASLTIVGPAFIRIHKYVDIENYAPEVNDYFFTDHKNHVINLTNNSNSPVFYKIYEKIPARPKLSNSSSLFTNNYEHLYSKKYISNNIQTNYIKLQDDLPLHNQGSGTFSLQGGFAKRLSQDKLQTKTIDYFQEILSYRYFSEINRIYFYKDLKVKELSRGKPSFGFNTRLDYIPLTIPFNIFGKLGINTQYFGSKQNFALLKTLGIKSKIFTNRKLSHRPLISISDRDLSYPKKAKKINPKAIDPDVYSNYAKHHKRWVNISYGASYRYKLDSTLSGSILWQSDKKFIKSSFVKYSLTYDKLIDWYIVGLNCSTKYYFKEHKKNLSFNRNTLGIHASFDRWLNKQNHRLEFKTKVAKIFDSNISNNLLLKQHRRLKAYSACLSITLHLGNGRNYRDFREEEIKFRQLKSQIISIRNEMTK